MPIGELLTRWTVRIALACFVLGATLRACSAERRTWFSLARLAWSVGCFAFVLHGVCAFQFYHHWSHSAAYEATARRTAQIIGLNWGGGLYANYAFAVLWMMDVVWWWRGLDYYVARPQPIDWFVLGFMGFIAFNSTVVFASGVIRWSGLVASAWIAIVLSYSVHARLKKDAR